MFENFDYFLIKDLNYFLHREQFIWNLLIDCGFLIEDRSNKKLKIRNEAIKKLIEKKFYEWKSYLFKKYNKIIDFFIIN